MHDLTSGVEKQTSELYYGIVTSDPQTTLSKNQIAVLYTSMECIVNEMVRRLGQVVGPMYVNSKTVDYWRSALYTPNLYKHYVTYKQIVLLNGLLKHDNSDSHRPVIDIFDLNAMDDTDNELEELESLGLGLSVTTNVIGTTISMPLGLCGSCGVFKPLSSQYFDESELFNFTRVDLLDTIMVGRCNVCK